MSRPLVVLRPEPGCTETVAAARAMGLAPVAAPLFSIEPVAWQVPEDMSFGAILAGSANAFRCGGEQLGLVRHLPVLAVGARTAEAAREAGFVVDRTGAGGLQAIVESLASPGRFLRLAGEARVTLSPPPGIEIVDAVVYRAAPLRLAPEAALALATGGVALLHSAEAARRFAAECDRLALPRAGIALAALAPRIAMAAGEGWNRVEIAPDLSHGALLAMAHDMCQ